MTRRTLVIVVVGCLAMVSGFYFFVWSPAGKTYKADQGRLDTLSQQKSSLQAQVASLKRVDANKLTISVAALNAAIPPTAELDNFFRQLHDAATASGESITAVSPSQPAAPSALTVGAAPSGTAEIKVAVTASGTYAQTSKFIDALDASPRLVVIDGVNVAKDPSAGALNTQLTLRVFSTQKVAAKPVGGAGTTGATTSGAPTTPVISGAK